MEAALEEAKKALAKNEVPIGAVLVHGRTGKIIGRAHNAMESTCNATFHAEMGLLHNFSVSYSKKSLVEYDLYVTLEPCPMCIYACSLAHIRRVYFGAYDFKSQNIIQKSYAHEDRIDAYFPEIYGGFLEESCGQMLKDFFKNTRQVKRG